MGYPTGLIRYTTENALARHLDKAAIWKRVFRVRTLLYTGLLLVIATAGGVSLYARNPLRVDIIRDRGALAREAASGRIENVYRMQLMNTDEVPRRYVLRASGVPELEVLGVEQPIDLKAASTRLFALRLQAPLERANGVALTPGPHKIELTVQAVDDEKVVRHEQSTFIIPR
jgi:polyferredoxin